MNWVGYIQGLTEVMGKGRGHRIEIWHDINVPQMNKGLKFSLFQRILIIFSYITEILRPKF